MNHTPRNDKARGQAGKSSNKNSKRANHTANGVAAQRSRLMDELLQRGSVTTLSARREIDVLHVAARIMELRQAGHRIDTVWTTDTTSEGHKHRVAKYVLVSAQPDLFRNGGAA